jgi:hypothetical protein
MSSHWIVGRDGDPGLLALYERHYSAYRYADGRKRTRCVGPGERIVLTTLMYDAAFVWKKFRSLDNQIGVNCSIFRNESPVRSSELIREAMTFAEQRWPGERLYTYVNPAKIASINPGYCFKVCGWKTCGTTKKRGLTILEYVP